MWTELTFLLELILNHKLTKSTKDLIATRIKEVESNLGASTTHIHTSGYMAPVALTSQAPNVRAVKDPNAQAASTQAILNSDPSLARPVSAPLSPEALAASHAVPTVAPVAQIAQTPQAYQALASRQEAIRIATSGKEERGRTSPRKF